MAGLARSVRWVAGLARPVDGTGWEDVAVVGFGWTVLSLVFLDELLAVAALGVYGWSASPRWLLVWLLPAVGVLAWWLFASPKAPFGTPVVRPVVKVLVFGLATLGLWSAGHHGSAVALLVFSLLVNGLAALPSVLALTAEQPGAARPRPGA